jgi:hypothetical protein
LWNNPAVEADEAKSPALGRGVPRDVERHNAERCCSSEPLNPVESRTCGWINRNKVRRPHSSPELISACAERPGTDHVRALTWSAAEEALTGEGLRAFLSLRRSHTGDNAPPPQKVLSDRYD